VSYTPPTVADFKSRFDRDFAYSATEGDLTKVRVKDIDLAFVQAAANFNEALFASQATYQESFLLLSAHFLVVNITASSQGHGGGSQWTTQSKSVGNVEESFAIPPRIARSPFLSQLSKTSYGMTYLQIILPLLCGNVALVAGDTTP
jgi:hypothetical protein